MASDADIGARLEQARKAAGLSREQVAERLGEGYSVSAIQAHENGRNTLKAEKAIRFSDLYKVNLQWLLSGRGQMQGSAEVIDIWSRILDEKEKEAWLAMGRAIAKED